MCQALILTVVAYDANQELLAEAPVTLTPVARSAVFSMVNLTQPVEHIASSGGLQPKTIRIEPALP